MGEGFVRSYLVINVVSRHVKSSPFGLSYSVIHASRMHVSINKRGFVQTLVGLEEMFHESHFSSAV